MYLSGIKCYSAGWPNLWKALCTIAVIIYAIFIRTVSAADPEMTIGVFSSTSPYRLNISIHAMKKNVPANWNSWATRLKIMRADGTPGSGVVLEDDAIGIFSEDGLYRLDIGSNAVKVATPASWNSWATRLHIRRLPGNTGTGAIKYGETIGIFSEGGMYRLDIGTQATKINTPAGWESWATILNVRRLGNKFAAYGDMPYSDVDAKKLEETILPGLAKKQDVPFVIHLGDAGRPGDPKYNACDHYFRIKTVESWYNILKKPVFFTPGDNDWTDCNSARQVQPPYNDPILALSDVRYVYYRTLETALRSNGFGMATQWSYPENQRWTSKDMYFATVHMVGSNNGWVSGDVRRQEEVTERLAANLYFLDRVFTEAAKRADISAVVIAFHVDPFEEGTTTESPYERCLLSPFYGDFCKALHDHAKQYGKPVLLVHGDTHQHCMDQPAEDLPNLWRLNAPGDFMEDPKDPMLDDADVVAFDAENIVMPFTVAGLLTGESPHPVCPPKPINSKPSPNE
ncbi:hypothetical protein GIV19_26105 [Pseudomonas syringae]|uniref:hypothetical protein n=1 Tax=Pseudomonas syringae TaxID=317 RepID=UPI001F2D9D85|nr:hypothetical protein [Pseudomonas syringae]MCF5710713.1 hypothetical protein [Pseudomonas syringae]